MPLNITWMATGNNVIVRGDTSRRVCHIRLQSPMENPEERDGFAHPDLKGWVHEYRSRLLSAALTILAAYCRAGRPDQGLRPWGSFERWSALVRNAVVWCGQPDPGQTRQELVRTADRESSALWAILEHWPDGREFTAAELVRCLDSGDAQQPMRDAIAEFCAGPAGRLPGADPWPRGCGMCAAALSAKRYSKATIRTGRRFGMCAAFRLKSALIPIRARTVKQANPSMAISARTPPYDGGRTNREAGIARASALRRARLIALPAEARNDDAGSKSPHRPASKGTACPPVRFGVAPMSALRFR